MTPAELGSDGETWYLCYFFHRLLDYRIPEFESLAKRFGCALSKQDWKQAPNHHQDSPFYFVRLPSAEVACKIANRSILVKAIFELWGQGSNFEELRAAIESYPKEKKLPYMAGDVSFKIIVDTFGKVITSEEQTKLIDSFDFIPFQGRVRLKNPQHKFWFMETDGQVINNGILPQPKAEKTLFFGRELGGADRSLVTKYGLSTRRYLGPTAMDAEIAYLMANQALARPGKLVYDPFVGTGSILVAAAHCGAITMGADIDVRVIRDGRGPNCNVWSNFEQYGLPPPVGLVRADNNERPWRSNLREVICLLLASSAGSLRDLLSGVRCHSLRPALWRSSWRPKIWRQEASTAGYTLEECLHDLLDMAAQLLVLGGRLVFFYPQARDEMTKFPEHACFELISSSEQILSTRYSRCLLTMEKTGVYTEELANAAREKHQEFRKNHAKLLEEKGSLRELVFTPQEALDPSTCAGDKQKAMIPKYRGKYV